MRQTNRQTKPERQNIEERLIATTDTHRQIGERGVHEKHPKKEVGQRKKE